LQLLKDLDILKQSGDKKSLEAIVQKIRSGGKNNINNYNYVENLKSSFKQPTKNLVSPFKSLTQASFKIELFRILLNFIKRGSTRNP